MKHWKMDERGSTVTSWLLDGGCPGSTEWDPLISKAHDLQGLRLLAGRQDYVRP
jgi:hypothetical protein